MEQTNNTVVIRVPSRILSWGEGGRLSECGSYGYMPSLEFFSVLSLLRVHRGLVLR